MKISIVGFDSAWSASNEGAICAASIDAVGVIELSVAPTTSSFQFATDVIDRTKNDSDRTIVFLDQPHIVRNRRGSRPVERIVSSLVGRMLGGVQRSATEQPPSRVPMFGPNAPVWGFINRYGGPGNPFVMNEQPVVIYETYPVLYLIASNWLIEREHRLPCLPKYNPARPSTFSKNDWQFVCNRAAQLAGELAIDELAKWLIDLACIDKPNKQLQDKLDSAICLLQAIEWYFIDEYLVIGDFETGYMLSKTNAEIEDCLRVRCDNLNKEKKDDISWDSNKWIKRVKKPKFSF